MSRASALARFGSGLPLETWQFRQQLPLLRYNHAIFGAETPKPTRFVSSIKTDDERSWFKWPIFSVDHKYLGPLPKECGHVHQKKLIGKTATGWATSPSAAYPPGLCEFLATLILSARCLVGGGTSSSIATEVSGEKSSKNSAVGVGSGASLGNAISPCNDATLCDQGGVSLSNASATLNNQSLNNQSLGDKGMGSPPSVEMEVETTGFAMAACKNHGQPISVEWDSKSRFFIDGVGICSPIRWQPWDPGVNRSPEGRALLT